MHGSVNVTEGEEEERVMITGLHTVVDIFCVGCGSLVGWKYVSTLLKLVYPSLDHPRGVIRLSTSFSSIKTFSYSIDHHIQEFAHEKNQKYKEGKFILER